MSKPRYSIYKSVAGEHNGNRHNPGLLDLAEGQIENREWDLAQRALSTSLQTIGTQRVLEEASARGPYCTPARLLLKRVNMALATLVRAREATEAARLWAIRTLGKTWRGEPNRTLVSLAQAKKAPEALRKAALEVVMAQAAAAEVPEDRPTAEQIRHFGSPDGLPA